MIARGVAEAILMAEHAVSAAPIIRTPSYDSAYREFLHAAVEGLMREDEGIGKIPMIRDRHSGPIRNVRTETPLDQPMRQIGATMELTQETLLETSVDGHTEMVYDFAQEVMGEQKILLYRNLGEMCDAAGMTVQNPGKGVPTMEQMRQLFGKMQFSFTESGEVNWPDLHVDPSQMERAKALIDEVRNDPEIAEIIAKKRGEWEVRRAAASRRTLSR